MTRIDHLNLFYDSLDSLEKRLGGTRRLSECSGRLRWPVRGVYFFMEPGEARTDTGPGPAGGPARNTRVEGRITDQALGPSRST